MASHNCCDVLDFNVWTWWYFWTLQNLYTSQVPTRPFSNTRPVDIHSSKDIVPSSIQCNHPGLNMINTHRSFVMCLQLPRTNWKYLGFQNFMNFFRSPVLLPIHSIKSFTPTQSTRTNHHARTTISSWREGSSRPTGAEAATTAAAVAGASAVVGRVNSTSNLGPFGLGLSDAVAPGCVVTQRAGSPT